jgi:nitrile hydratase accessory protein
LSPLDIASIPRDGEGPVFQEPWQARAFALAVELNRRDLLSWSEWSQTLGRHIAAAGPDDDGVRFYEHWVAALEDILGRRGIVAQR